MPIPRSVLRLTDDELNELLSSAREVHLATVGSDGEPHVAPLWFVWHDGSIWVNSLIKSRRSRDLAAGSRVAVCADAGEHYGELRGVVLKGSFVEATEDRRLPEAHAAFAQKYWGGSEVPVTKSHVWLRLEHDKAEIEEHTV